MEQGEAVEESRASPGEVAMPPQDPRYVSVTDEDDNTHGYLAHWRTDEWIYAEEDATRYFDWTEDDGE